MNREIYIGEDGLDYCTTCEEPVEVLLPQNVQRYLNMKTHPRQCACVRERNAREEKPCDESRHQSGYVLKNARCESGILQTTMERIRI